MPGFTPKATRKVSATVKRVANDRRILHQPRRSIVPPGGKTALPQYLVIELYGSPNGGDMKITVKTITENEEGEEEESEEKQVTFGVPCAFSEIVNAFVASGLFTGEQVESAGGGDFPIEPAVLMFKKGISLKNVFVTDIDCTNLTDAVHQPYSLIRRVGI